MFTVRVPATIANMGPGFDSFGMALQRYNLFHVSQSDKSLVTLSPKGCLAAGDISGNPAGNLIFTALERFYAEVGKPAPALQIEIEASIPMARGLGSSSTAIVCGLVIGNELENKPLSEDQLVRLATELEGHPDNVAPALLGGIQLCDERGTHTLPWPEDWGIGVVISGEKILTESARKVLPEKLSYEDAIFNVRKASLLIYALLKQDGKAFSDSLYDRLHQPYRGELIPDFKPVSSITRENGAFGAVISGSGSTLAFFYPKTTASGLFEALADYNLQNCRNLLIEPSAPDTEGARVIRPGSHSNIALT